MSDLTFTPQQIENRLFELSKEIDSVQNELADAEGAYTTKKAAFEVAMAKSRLGLTGIKMTQAEREDRALIANEDAYLVLNSVEVLVKALRQKMANLRVQVDIARSIGSSIKASMESL